MHCPACRTSRLQPAKLEDGLLGHGCPQCSGTLVSLLHYRDWAERQPGRRVWRHWPPRNKWASPATP